MSFDAFGARRFYNAATDFIDSHGARADKAAFIDDAASLTFGALRERTCRFGASLRARGFAQETRVIMIMHDTIDFPVVFWGAIRAGLVPVPLNTLLTPAQHAYMLEDSRAPVVVVSAALAPALAPVLEHARHVKLIITAGGDALPVSGKEGATLAAVLAAGSPEPFLEETLADDVAFWLYSSGSTGAPKVVRHLHASLGVTAKLYGGGVLGMRADDVVFSAAKLFFAYGLGNGMTFPLSVGATTVLHAGRPTPDAVFAVMAKHQPTLFFGVPTLYTAMLASAGLGPGAGSARLRLCASAGEALPAAIGERWRQRVGVDILDGIGSTEMLHIFLSNQTGALRYGTSGKAVPGYGLRIVDEAGRDAADGEIGELLVRGGSAGDGYWNQRAKSLRTFVGEWTYTGDKYVRDGDGFYTYCGRTDDMFKVSGIWVSPFEVETALASHDAVYEAAVVGAQDVDGLLKPKAFLVLRPGCEPDAALVDALKAHVKERAGPWKYPRWIEFRDELPKTATGKIQRFLLRAE